jgi:hypothetical protein
MAVCRVDGARAIDEVEDLKLSIDRAKAPWRDPPCWKIVKPASRSDN